MLLEVGVGYLSHSFAVGERTWEEEKSLDVLDFEENLLESVGEFSAYSPTDNAAIIQCKCIGNAYSQPVRFLIFLQFTYNPWKLSHFKTTKSHLETPLSENSLEN